MGLDGCAYPAAERRKRSGEVRAPGSVGYRGADEERGGEMDDGTKELTDDDMRTVMPGAAETGPGDMPGDTDGKDAGDGTDGDGTDGRDGDAADMGDTDGTDTKDADGMDSGDTDGTDAAS
jgi:hypothetical protein